MNYFKNKAYLSLGFVLVFFSTFAQNQKIADSLILVYKYASLNDSAKLEVLSNIAFNASNPDIKLNYSELLIDLAKNKSIYTIRGYYYKGNALKLKGKLDEAIQAFIISIQLAEKAKYLRGIGSSNVALGDIYRISGNHNNSIFYFNKAIKNFREQNDSVPLAIALLNTGNEYLVTNQLDTALSFFEEANRIYERFNYKTGIAYCNGNIGRIYALHGNYGLAEKKIGFAIQLLKELKDSYALASFQIRLSNIYLQEGKTHEAIESASNSYDISLKIGLKAQIRDASEQLSIIYSAIKDYKKAYLYQSKYIAYRDSINNEETIRKIADLRTEYEVAKKQTEVDLLVKKRKISSIISGGLITVIFLTLVLLFVLYRNYCRKKTLNKLLLEQKEEMKAQQEQLENLNHTKDRFFSIISHDLRGPVSSLGSLPVLFKEYIASNDINELSELIVHMDNSIQQVSNLLDNLLEWALSQQGTFPYHPDTVVLNNVITEVYSMFSTMAETKGIRLMEVIHEEVIVLADKNSLMTIIRNLLNNAIKFTPQGGSITLTAEKKNSDAWITIKDTGVGMPEEKLQTLFHLNEKKSTWGTDHEKGLGIGLCLVHDFVLMNNGTIKAESKEGQGTSFTVTIPLA
jgi:two-component system, NtrC family, sensor kinase